MSNVGEGKYDNIHQTQLNTDDFDQITTDLEHIATEAQESIQKGLKLLGDVLSGRVRSECGCQELQPPAASLLSNAADLAIMLGLVQDALNQLMQQVSKLEIDQKMTQSVQANEDQLANLEEQMKEIEKALKKQNEADKKSNMFQAISDWVQAAISFVSATISLVAAVGYAMSGNVVGAAGMFTAAACMYAACACQVTLAIDSTMKASGEDGFLSDKQRENLQTAAMVLSIVGGVAAMIGGLGVMMQGMKEASKAAATAITQETGKVATQQAVKEATRAGIKEAMRELMKLGAQKGAQVAGQEAAKQAFIQCCKIYFTQALAQGLTQGVAQGALGISTGVVTLEIAELIDQANEAMKKAEDMEAANQALQAIITLLQALIEQIQEQIETLMEQSAESMEVIFGTADDCQHSTKKVIETVMA